MRHVALCAGDEGDRERAARRPRVRAHPRKFHASSCLRARSVYASVASYLFRQECRRDCFITTVYWFRVMMRSYVPYRIATQGVSLQQAVLQHAAWSGNAEVIQVLWEKHDARLDVRALS